MTNKEEVSLEYFMTYGWALILNASIIAVLVFVVITPASKVSFSSSNTRILLKGSSASGGDAIIKLQNITGGTIKITNVAVTDYSICSFLEGGLPLTVNAGAEMILSCTGSSTGLGTVSLEYTDHANLARNVVIAASGSASEPELESSCAGYEWDGYCWYQGAVDENCTEVCSVHGGNVGTCQENDNESCDLCDYFASSSLPCWPLPLSLAPGRNTTDFYCAYRDAGTSGDCSISLFNFRRFCACNE